MVLELFPRSKLRIKKNLSDKKEGEIMDADEKKAVIKKKYGEIAMAGGSCCCSSACCGVRAPSRFRNPLVIQDDQILSYQDANLGLGCGNPTAFAELKPGDVVLDLGSGAGFDCFLAAQKVGEFRKGNRS